MAKLKAKQRKRLPASSFAGPNRSFPIHDKPHARAALRMASKSNKVSYSTIRRRVCNRYPGLATCRKGK